MLSADQFIICISLITLATSVLGLVCRDGLPDATSAGLVIANLAGATGFFLKGQSEALHMPQLSLLHLGAAAVCAAVAHEARRQKGLAPVPIRVANAVTPPTKRRPLDISHLN